MILAELTNKKGIKDMTKGSIVGNILAFAIPVFLSQAFQQFYNTCDAYIVGLYLGSDALGAVTSSGSLIFLLVSFFTGVSMGAGVVISHYFGEGDEDNVKKTIHTTFAFGLASGLFLSVFGVIMTPFFLKWMNTDALILPSAIAYFRYYFMGGITVVMYNICRSIMNALGDSRRPLYYLMISTVINIGLDFLFVGAFGWGVWAASFATVLSQTVSVILCLIHLFQPNHLYTVKIKEIRFHKKHLLEIIRYGLPSGVQNSVIGFANVIVQSQINTFGHFATTAYGVHSKIEGFGFLPITSFNMASTTFISQNLGAKEYDRAKKGARFCLIVTPLFAELIGLIIYNLAPTLIGIFDKTPEVIELGSTQAKIVTLFYFLLAFSHSVAALLRGAGKPIVPMVIMLSIWCVFRVSYIAVIMTFVKDIQYIYWAYPLTWAISSIIYFCYYKFSDWVHGYEKRKKSFSPSK